MLRNHHADPTSAIDSSNIARLRQAWSFEAPAPVSHTPLIESGRVYAADWDGNVYAFDAQTGDVVWRNKVEQPKTQWPWHGFAGTGALGGGMVFQASTEGTAFALDARTGEVRWRTRITDDPHAGSICRLTHIGGIVLVGLQSVEEPLTKMMQNFTPDFQGEVMALDAATGWIVWRTPLVRPPHNGVAVWSSFAVDPQTFVVYFTTGNNYTGEATPLSDSIVAVNGRNGEILWASQVTQNDVWTMAHQRGPDYDFGGGPQIFDVVIGGRVRRLVGAGQKSGIFYVWDRYTGQPVWSSSIGYGGVDGGMHGEASIGRDRIIAWSNNNYSHTTPPAQSNLSIKALDPATGRYLWVNDNAQPALLFSAGFLADDVYLLGSLDAKLRAYSAGDGQQVWSADLPGPVTSALSGDGGRVLLGTGAPGVFGSWASGGKNTVTAFALPQQ
ncbi:MAG TPA: PQQ-binding-like beta-propeller repeat protein [Falsiroseomonas sp.]|jgi:polyvinyl alcohol dehydrogenase (cytochrome)|nr:PQQ-binding-like beta-propeller repeat protein [Falsiroseomonas sp.]